MSPCTAASSILSRWSGFCNFSTATWRAGRRLSLIGESVPMPHPPLTLLELRVICPAYIFPCEVRSRALLPGRQGCRSQLSADYARVRTHLSRHRDGRSMSGGYSWVARCPGESPLSVKYSHIDMLMRCIEAIYHREHSRLRVTTLKHPLSLP